LDSTTNTITLNQPNLPDGTIAEFGLAGGTSTPLSFNPKTIKLNISIPKKPGVFAFFKFRISEDITDFNPNIEIYFYENYNLSNNFHEKSLACVYPNLYSPSTTDVKSGIYTM
jgi:hypothetical protein